MAHYKIYSEICLKRTLNKLNIRFSPNIVNFSEFDLSKPNTCLFQTKCLVWKGFDLDRFHCLWIVKHTPPPSFFLILPRSNVNHIYHTYPSHTRFIYVLFSHVPYMGLDFILFSTLFPLYILQDVKFGVSSKNFQPT